MLSKAKIALLAAAIANVSTNGGAYASSVTSDATSFLRWLNQNDTESNQSD